MNYYAKWQKVPREIKLLQRTIVFSVLPIHPLTDFWTLLLFCYLRLLLLCLSYFIPIYYYLITFKLIRVNLLDMNVDSYLFDSMLILENYNVLFYILYLLYMINLFISDYLYVNLKTMIIILLLGHFIVSTISSTNYGLRMW